MKTRKILAISPNGTLYIKAKEAGMAFLCLLIDGVPLHYFGKGSTPYLTVDQAIAWHEKELPYCKDKTSETALVALRKIKVEHEAGRTIIES